MVMKGRHKVERIHSKQRHLRVVSAAPPEDEMSFERLFERFAPYVAAVALRLLGDEADVDDIVQEVFWDCSRKSDDFRDVDHARHWLAMVTVRKTRRLLRKRKILALFHLPLTSKVNPPMPSVSADDRAVVIHLFGILDKLPTNHRLAWTFRFLQGAELTEVAEACGCSLATAKRWIGAANDVIKGGEDD